MAPFIQQIPVGPMANFAYLLGDLNLGEGAIVDPGWEAKKLCDEADRQRLAITKILLTHTHFDHVRALPELLGFVRAPVYVHSLERNGVPGDPEIVETHEGMLISLGSLSITCLHTPGHSPGGQCFHVENLLITGDTLFVDACGRVDLPGSDPRAMELSLQRLAQCPDDWIIYPGHDYGPTRTATLGDQKRTNPYLRS